MMEYTLHCDTETLLQHNLQYTAASFLVTEVLIWNTEMQESIKQTVAEH